MGDNATVFINRLTLGYDKNVLARDFTFRVFAGERISIVGASGAGKTTLLRTVAGLHAPTSGNVTIDGQNPKSLYGTGRLQYLHQDPALWNHLTVHSNIQLVLDLLKVEASESRISKLVDELGLAGSEKKYPGELSRGMRARLALARAFAKPPGVLLVDEPFASLDFIRREALNEKLSILAKESRSTILMVTHDIVEALRFSSRMIVFEFGGHTLTDLSLPSPQEPIDPNSLPSDYIDVRDRILEMIGEPAP